MKRSSITILLFFFEFVCMAQPVFQLTIGGSASDGGRSITKTADGGYAIAGTANAFTVQDAQMYMAKINNAGTLQWTKAITGVAGYLAGRCIIQTSDGGYAITGRSDYWTFEISFVKLDASGNVEWSKNIHSGAFDQGYSVFQTADNGYIISGRTFSSIGTYSAYIIKFDSAGNLQWTASPFGFEDGGYSIVQTSDMGYAVGGFTMGSAGSGPDMHIAKLNSSGTVLWTRAVGGAGSDLCFPGAKLIQTNDGGYAMAGYTNSFGAGNNDVYVVKLNGSGNLLWTRVVGGPADEYATGIVQSADHGYAIAGSTSSFGSGGEDAYMVKLDSNGVLQWTRTTGGTGDDAVFSVVQANDGGYVFAGTTASYGNGGQVYVVKLDATGSTCGTSSSGGTSTTGGTAGTGSGGNGGNGPDTLTTVFLSGSPSGSLSFVCSCLPSATITPSGPVTFCNGGSVVLNANTGTGLSYQWKRNTININNATLSNYTAATSGTYTVAVTNTCGTSTSPGIVVAVGTASPATITGPTSFCAGLSNILTANTGAGITYQWYRNGIAQGGAVSGTYNANSNGTYYVIETSSCGTSQSNSMVVTQINNANPAISYNTPLSFCSPGNVVLTSNTFGGVQYQWQKNSTDIAGATLQNYTAASNGSYRVRQTANGCYKYSPGINTTTATGVTATITANGPVTFCTGGSVVLSVSNAIPGYGYQWKKNNINISNATQSNYTATTAGSYTCAVTASCGTATSNAIVVSTGGITASITPSGSISICAGASAILNANTGSGYTYQWKKNGTNITGATLSSYNATTAGSYTVAITSPCGNATSAATTVSISNVTATIIPAGTTVICAGLGQTFTANSGFNYSYQWYRNGVAQAGSTAQTYSNSSNGSYTVKITQGASCSATSAAAILSVTNNPTPAITAGGPTTFCVGQNVILTANTFAGVQLQWQKNSTDITGATNTSYTATTTGAYRVKQTANGCYKTSTTIAVTVNCRLGEDIKDESKNELVVYPNPFSNELTVYGVELISGDRILLINMLGEVVLSEKVATSTNSYQMKVENIKSGIYFMQVITSAEKKIVKVVK